MPMPSSGAGGVDSFDLIKDFQELGRMMIRYVLSAVDHVTGLLCTQHVYNIVLGTAFRANFELKYLARLAGNVEVQVVIPRI